MIHENVPDCSYNTQHSNMPIEKIEQRYFNQFIYGKWGLRAEKYQQIHCKIIIQNLLDLAQTSSKYAQAAQKGIIKHLDYLSLQIQKVKNDNDLENLVLYQENI